MRARKDLIAELEAKCHRAYVFAGKRKGANVAAWKQAAAAELAATALTAIRYGQALLDFVRAFDRIPYALIVREAIALEYPLHILRLSVATYRIKRVIRIRNVVPLSELYLVIALS